MELGGKLKCVLFLFWSSSGSLNEYEYTLFNKLNPQLS